MEVLRIQYEWTNGVPNANCSQIFTLSTKNFGTTQPTLGLGDATVIGRFLLVNDLTTSGMASTTMPYQQDLTDGDGHGVLVGNQNLYWTLTSQGTSQANRIGVKMLYRAKRISDSELLGIVLQSNQN